MRQKRNQVKKQLVACLLVAITANVVFSQQLPTAKEIALKMGLAWNLGNSMEATGGPTAWGNPLPTQQLIDSVKAAGINTIRIPTAWDANADQNTYIISDDWMKQVKQVVDYCIKDSLFVVLNIHWDGGWLENKIDSCVNNEEMKEKISKKQGAYWRQIATTFKDYDYHLLFAGTNEPNVKDAASYEVLKSFLQIFIDTVRATGGNNASRTLIVQGPNTDIEKTNNLMNTLPTDKVADRMMAEVHFYPYQFTLMETDADWGKVFYYWGKNNHSETDTDRNPTWGEESFVDSVFNLMKVKFVDKGIPVLLGEFGAVKRMALTGESLKLHILSRRSFYEYVASSCKKHGLIPVAWDAGGKGNLTMTMFDRKTGEIYDLGLLNAYRYGWGLSKLPGDTSLVQVATGNKSLKVLYSAKDSLFGQVNLGVVKPDMTSYESITVRAYVNGDTKYDSLGESKTGYVALSLVTMSDNWTWRDAALGQVTMDDWNEYTVPISNDTTEKGALVPADPSKIDFFAVQAYSVGYRGTIYIDWITFKSKSGKVDTVYSFDLIAPDAFGGNVDEVTLIPTESVQSDKEWETATTSVWGDSHVLAHGNVICKSINVAQLKDKIRVNWVSANSGIVKVSMKNLLGQAVLSRSLVAKSGTNTLFIPSGNFNGLMILEIVQNNQKYVGKVICK